MPVSAWSTTDKIAETLRRSKRHLPAHLAGQVDALLSPGNLALMAGTLALWAGSHFFGVGEIVDVALLTVGAFTIGWSVVDVAQDLFEFGTTAVGAQSEDDLERAAQAFARAAVRGGMTVITALLLRRGARQIQGARGPGLRAAIRPRQRPGLVPVEPDPMPGTTIRRPPVTGNPNLPPGAGSTTAFGEVTYSTAGSATQQQLALAHELVHSYLSPRLAMFRTFRARLSMSAYVRSAIMQYLEEALAETIAQLRINGLSGLLTGVRFPLRGGYALVTRANLMSEGAAIGTIVVGTWQFSVKIVPDGPDLEAGNMCR
ncbi:MAG: hypothetical protein ABI977_06310 [Acidobacteriota bacterium]